MLLKVFIGNWSSNWDDFDYFPSNVLCCTKCIFYQFDDSITKNEGYCNFLKLAAQNEVHYISIRSRRFVERCLSLSSIFQLVIICRSTPFFKDFKIGILLKPYYRINSIIISKKKFRKNGFSKCASSFGGYHRRRRKKAKTEKKTFSNLIFDLKVQKGEYQNEFFSFQ